MTLGGGKCMGKERTACRDNKKQKPEKAFGKVANHNF
jgi:hypothetical protein